MHKAVYGSQVLAAGGIETLSGVSVNGQQVNDEFQFIRAAAVSFAPRGNRSTPIAFAVTRQFDSHRAAARFVHAHFNDLAPQAALYLRLGTDADGEWVRYDGAVIDSCECQQLGVSVTTYYAFRCALPAFESSAPDTPEPDAAMKADSTPIPSGDDEIAVVFASPFATTPRITGLTVTIPSGGDSIWAHVVDGTVTVNGFTAQLSAPVPATGYKLTWSAL